MKESEAKEYQLVYLVRDFDPVKLRVGIVLRENSNFKILDLDTERRDFWSRSSAYDNVKYWLPTAKEAIDHAMFRHLEKFHEEVKRRRAKINALNDLMDQVLEKSNEKK
jgi:hypothetical protein